MSALTDCIRARNQFIAARQALMDSLPEAIQAEIHWNGRHARVPKRYMKAAALLLETRP